MKPIHPSMSSCHAIPDQEVMQECKESNTLMGNKEREQDKAKRCFAPLTLLPDRNINETRQWRTIESEKHPCRKLSSGLIAPNATKQLLPVAVTGNADATRPAAATAPTAAPLIAEHARAAAADKRQ